MEIPTIQCGLAQGVSLDGLIDALADEGLCPERLDDEYVALSHGEKKYIATCPKDEKTLIVFYAPQIYALSEREDREAMLETLNEINFSSRMGKIYIYNDAIWVRIDVRHQRMGMATTLLTAYIEDIDEVVKAFYEYVFAADDGQPETLQ